MANIFRYCFNKYASNPKVAVAIPVHWCFCTINASYSPELDNIHPAIQANTALILPTNKANEIGVFKSMPL